jgi:hypothetical protein
MVAVQNHGTCTTETIGAEEQIIAAVRQSVTGAFPRELRAIVLTGSLARCEGTWTYNKLSGVYSLGGDAEFLVVFEEENRLPSAQQVRELTQATEIRLHEESVEAHLGLSPIAPRYLQRLRPHIFAYELLRHGRVIWGDKDILSLAPGFSIRDIPLEDGFQILLNRIIELLEALCSSSALTSDVVRYRAMKLWLDMATSFLLFRGQYESTYRSRAERLRQIASRTGDDGEPMDAPITPSRFSERVSVATDFKLSPSSGAGRVVPEDLVELIEDARSLWRWELEHLTGQSGGVSDDELLNQWRNSEELPARIRGWAATAKRHGLWRSAYALHRWARLVLRGSPRRLVYSVASRVFFRLPAILSEDGNGLSGAYVEVTQPIYELPVVNKRETEDSWQGIGRAIAWNYHQFLETTRS